jgi:hypothetical protein
VGRRPSVALAALSAIAAIPAALFAATMLAQARQAGPSCFLGACAFGDRLAELAALAIAVVLAGFSAASRVEGWRITVWCVAFAAALFGAASIALPTATGSLGPFGGISAVVWGVLFAVVGERERR